MNELKVMAERMRMLQREKEETEEMLKGINRDLDELRLRLIPEYMAENDLRTVTLEGIGRISLTMDCYASVLPDMKFQAYEWLAMHGFDGLIQAYVQPSTLKATIKEGLKAGQTFPEDLFKVQPFTRASITKI